MSAILITGATGFIGRVAARHLVAEGLRTRALVRGAHAPERLVRAVGENVECASGDLRDSVALRRAVADCAAVVHLAAVVDPALTRDAAGVDSVNRMATIELARQARDAGCRHFVFVSSIAAMGFASGLATPDSPCRPLTAYGHAKRSAEQAVLALRTDHFRPIVLRLPTVYGPGERYNFLLWVRAVERGRFRVIGSGNNVFPLVTTDNVARAVGVAAVGGLTPGVHLVADRDRYTVGRVHAAIAGALGKRAPRVRVPMRLAMLAGAANEALNRFGIPLVLSRARVRTLTADQPFDVTSLLGQGVALDAPLEQVVRATVDDYRVHALL